MNPQPSSNNEQNPETKSEMELFFEEGEQYYREYLRLQGQTDTEWEDEEEKLYQIGFNRNMAIESLLRCVNQAVQNIRIHALFFLVELHPDREDSAKKEGYFYQAVELIRHYYGEDFQHTPEWKNIIDLYLNSIEPDFAQKFPKKYIPFLSPLLTVNILSECRTRMQERLEEAANIIQSGTYPDFHSDTIAWLEEIFGPMRIHIHSEEGDEKILCHRFASGEKPEEGAHVYHTTVDIFDKEAKYIVSIDRGGSGEINTFKLSHLEHIIYPIIDIYIRKKEYALFTDISDHGAFIQQYEERAEHYQPKNNYGYFIERVLSKYSAESSGDDVYKCQQSIDICRIVTAQHIGNNHFSGDTLPQRIDTILGGAIQRDVFLLVQSHLMTRHETMNGIGYPFGLSKNRIPIESRIYTIVRAYEALYSMYSYQPEKIISTLEDWGNGGYFDTGILSIFLDILRDLDNPIRTLPGRMPSKISEYRSKIYKNQIRRWKDIIDQMKLIEKDYDVFRSAYTHNDSQNSIAKSMNEGVLKLRRMANIRTIFLVTLHGKTGSDRPGGPPGNDDEHITEEGRLSSEEKGKTLQGMKVYILASPILRSIESAYIICQRINACIEEFCISCLHVREEEILRNPAKNKENGRYNSYAQKLFQDNTNGLMEFVIDSVSFSGESTNLCITHRDLGRHLIFWLNNLFSQEKTIGEKTVIENDTILVFLFQGDACIPWNLGFPVFGWKKILAMVNTLSEEILGEPFYDRKNEKVDLIALKVNLIALHDRFLDFIDYHRENSPEQISEFQRKLRENPITKDLSEFITKTP